MGKIISNPFVIGAEALNQFRCRWHGSAIIDLLRMHNGKLLLTWPVGVGKSVNLDDVVKVAITSDMYELVIVLLPTTMILEEREWIKHPPSGVNVHRLRPRPQENCGCLNASWLKFEANHMGSLARILLCNKCIFKNLCNWIFQYGIKLRVAQVIYCTQTHLENDPLFIYRISKITEKKKVLVLIDESNIIIKNNKRTISRQQLLMYMNVLNDSTDDKELLLTVKCLLSATNEDLRSDGWIPPIIKRTRIVGIQKQGYKLYNHKFKDITYDILYFCISEITSREKDEDGNILFAISPFLKCDAIIYSATLDAGYAKLKTSHEFGNPFANHIFSHPDTKWYNIVNRIGMKKYFKKHSPQIFDFYSQLIATRIREGKRVLLVSKLSYKKFCKHKLEKLLHKMGLPVTIVIENWEKADLQDINIIPLIHYGIIGINLFQHYDCAYCLNGFYVDNKILQKILQDIYASDITIPLSITTKGKPKKRSVIIDKYYRYYGVSTVANKALQQLEIGSAIQTVGRVRPYTLPREIILLQCSDVPNVKHVTEFGTLKSAINFFGFANKRTRNKQKVIADIQVLKEQGYTQMKIAEKLKKSLSTVKRYWNKGMVSLNIKKTLTKLN